MTRIPVHSSNLKAVGYDAKTRVLELEFQNGRVYRYEGVEKNIHDDLMHAPSVGRYFREHILGNYDEHEVVEQSQPEPIKGSE